MPHARAPLHKAVVIAGESKTEAGEGRTIPLNADVLAALVAHSKWYLNKFGETRPEWYVLPFGKPQPTDPARPGTSFKTVWAAIKKEAGVTGRWHDNRHTFITDLAESGEASDETIRDMAVHVSKQMLKHYSHPDGHGDHLSRFAPLAGPRFRLCRFRGLFGFGRFLGGGGLLGRPGLGGRTLGRLCATLGLGFRLRLRGFAQALDALPDPARTGLSILEALHGLYASQAIPDCDQPLTITFITPVADTSKAILLVIGMAMRKRWCCKGQIAPSCVQ